MKKAKCAEAKMFIKNLDRTKKAKEVMMEGPRGFVL